MLQLPFQQYTIIIDKDDNYKAASADNLNSYDVIYGEGYNQHSVAIKQGDTVIKSVLVCAGGGTSGIHPDTAIIVGSAVLLACGDEVLCLMLPQLELQWRTRVDEMTCFGIYKKADAIFTYGELEISRLSTGGQIIWQKSFRDILVRPDGGDAFTLYDTFIEIQDFDNYHYKVDFDGNILEEKQVYVPLPNNPNFKPKLSSRVATRYINIMCWVLAARVVTELISKLWNTFHGGEPANMDVGSAIWKFGYIPLVIILLQKRNKWGWVLAMFGAIMALVSFNHVWEIIYVDPLYILDAVLVTFNAVFIFLLLKREVKEAFGVTPRTIKWTFGVALVLLLLGAALAVYFIAG